MDRLTGDLDPGRLVLDPAPSGLSNGNGVFEPGERAVAAPSWRNAASASVDLSGIGSTGSGPAGATYSIEDAGAGYGSLSAGATADCLEATSNCYSLSASVPAVRPATHWDAFFTESLNAGDVKVWPVHLGRSFTDVPSSHFSYKSVETILHAGVGAGCGTTTFCPSGVVTRAQIAVFLLRSKHGTAYLPPPATGTVFSDVPAASFAAAWIEELSAAGITGGCGGGLFCPLGPVTRASMAVLLLRTEHGRVHPARGHRHLLGCARVRRLRSLDRATLARRCDSRLRGRTLLSERLRDARPDGRLPGDGVPARILRRWKLPEKESK